MSAFAHYWRFNRLNNQGKIKVEDRPEAKNLINSQFVAKNPQSSSDTDIQRFLFTLLCQHDSLAEICLRCFISEQIKQICIKLEQQFGNSHQFNRYDLFPFVLDDTLTHPNPSQTSDYCSMATKILRTFDPNKASLSTWTTRLVRYEQNLNQFLLERGIYLISDWAILNDTNTKQLQRIFREFHALNETEISQGCLLLEAYHQVYRADRLATRIGGSRRKCSAPTDSQLQRMAQLTESSLTLEQILTHLKDIAEKLREYRIYVRGGKPKQDSLENPNVKIKVEQQQIAQFQDDSAEETQNVFLSRYRQQFLICLEIAIASVVTQWLNQKKDPKKQQFFEALKLFHCRGISMTEIASAIGFSQQYQVSRLMKLKNFRADIRQKMLQTLRQQIHEMAAIYTSPEQLLKQEQQIEIALEEQVSAVIEQAEAEASTAKNKPQTSLFAQTLCRYLDQKEQLS